MAHISRATHVLQGRRQWETNEQSRVNPRIAFVVQIGGCNSPSMKAESLVIVDQHATVNGLRPCTHRPSRQGRESGLKGFAGNVFVLDFESSIQKLFLTCVLDRHFPNRDEVVTR